MRPDLVTLGVLPAFTRHFPPAIGSSSLTVLGQGDEGCGPVIEPWECGGGVRRIQWEWGAPGWEGGGHGRRGDGACGRALGVVVCVSAGTTGWRGHDVPHEERTVFATSLRPTPLLGSGLGRLPQLPAASGNRDLRGNQSFCGCFGPDAGTASFRLSLLQTVALWSLESSVLLQI